MTTSGCDLLTGETPANAYRSWKDRLVVRTGIPFFGLTPPCFEWVEEDSGGYYAGIPTDQCYKMLPPQRWKGLWRDDFEGSQFCAAPARECSFVSFKHRSRPVTWLEVEHLTKKEPDGALYSVELIGRRTAVAGRYGHLGMFDHALIVDRFISMKQIEAPPKQEE